MNHESYVILDASAVKHHCYHMGTDPENSVTSAEFAFANFIERYMVPILEIVQPRQILIAHDGGIEYRRLIYKEYKAQRGAGRDKLTPEELAIAEAEDTERDRLMMFMKSFWSALGCTQAKVDGVEADDLIAYFCQQLKGMKQVYTSDGDMLQLVNETTQVFIKGELQDAGAHKGIPYECTSVAKSMLGDPSDNYPGIRGFGPAKFSELLEHFDIDGILELESCIKANDFSLIEEVLEETPSKALRILYDNRQEWRTQYLLAQLHPELCWKPRAKKLVKIEWFKRIASSKKLMAVLSAAGVEDQFHVFEPYVPYRWAILGKDVDEALFSDFEEEVAKSPIVAFDYETYMSENAMRTTPKGEDFVDVFQSIVAGCSFCFGENLQYTVYIPTAHKDTDNVDPSVIARLLKIADGKLVAQNAFFEIAITKTNFDIWLGKVCDTQIMMSYVDENKHSGLKSMSKSMLNYQQVSYDEVTSDGEGGNFPMNELTLEQVFSYGADDSTVTASLYDLLKLQMELEGSWEFYHEYNTYVAHSLVDSYLKGCPIDRDALQEQRKKDEATLVDSIAELREILEEYCLEGNPEAAMKYAKEEKDAVVGKVKMKYRKMENPPPQEEIIAAMDDAYSNFRSECVEASFYHPIVEHKELSEFKPTSTQLTKVVYELGFSTPIEKTSRRALSDWLSEAVLIDMDKNVSTQLTPEQTRFTELLGACLQQISKREGAEYEEFAEFCSQFMNVKLTTTGDELSVGSPKQMAQLLYCKLGIPIRLRNIPTAGSTRAVLGLQGSPKTDALAMATALANDTEGEDDWKYKALKLVHAAKSATTRISLYHDPYPKWVHPVDSRIHGQIIDCGTVTRRPTGTSPNLLQVSKHQEDGVMRSIFIPQSEEEVIVSIDFSQQELCVMASESKDDAMIACFVGDNKRDVHSSTAAGILHISYEDYKAVYSDENHPKHYEYVGVRKRPAKATNFLFAYLGTPVTLSQRLIIPFEEAEKMLGAAFDTYPKVGPWQEAMAKFARVNGYTETAYGNRRHMPPEIMETGSKGRRVERQAVNAIIQSTCADILKIVLTKAWTEKVWKETGSTLIAPVYDEITASVPKSKVVEYIRRMVTIMEITPPNHAVPMTADVSLGRNWRDQVEIGVRPSREKIENALTML